MVLLSEGPMHAYQIEKEIEGRSMRFWTEISMSSIYKLLKKLESGGLIVSAQEPSENGMTRNVFSLTSDGSATLRAQLAGILSEPEHMRWRIDLATSHLDVLPPGDVREHLATYRAALQEEIDGYARLEEYLKGDGCPPHALALARRPACLLKAELEWLDGYVAELAEQNDG